MRLTAALLVFLFAVTWTGYAQDPSALRNKADSNMMAAEKMMLEATQMVKQRPGRETRKLAISLLTKAGQMLEEAANIYQALAPQYASPQEAKIAKDAMQYCIDSIQKLKTRL